MVFNSLVFVVFFAITAAFHHSNASWRAKKIVLTCASCVFYGVWNPPFLALLWVTILLDFFVARTLQGADDPRRRRLLIMASLVGNLGLLAYFKYGRFVLENVADLAAAVGIHWVPPRWEIALPVGISFYTFHTLSYTIDVYRRELVAKRQLLDLAVFVSFFPVLVAGPIVRAAYFLPQLEHERRGSAEQWSSGLTLLVVGLFQKMVLADGVFAPLVDSAFLPDHTHSFADAWLGTLAFSGQIFFDFAGYSLCAIGVARCFGFDLADNFRGPYGAYGFSDFWRRWHISLSSWLRDYLYVPLGGNRGGARRTERNLMLTMLIGGLWHGAAWTYVVWGGLHGVFLVGERWLRGRRPAEPTGAVRLAFGIVVTYLLTCLAWCFFRSSDFTTAWEMLRAMFGFATATPGHLPSLVRAGIAGVVIVAMVVVHAVYRQTHIESLLAALSPTKRGVMIGVLLFSIAIAAGGQRAFIYFQF